MTAGDAVAPSVKISGRGAATLTRSLTLLAASLAGAQAAGAELSSEELAKIAQNPVDTVISVPFQNNVNFNVGPATARRTS